MLKTRKELDLPRLVRRCQLGDARAWDDLVEGLSGMVFSTARRQGLSEDDASDVMQLAFVALYRNLDRIEDPQTLPKWLATTAAREGYRLLRTRDRTTELSDDLDRVLAAEDSQADDLAAAADAARLVRQELKNLGGKCEQLLTQMYLEERQYKEISDSLGIAMGAIGPTRARCLEKLKKLLGAAGLDDSMY